MASVFSAHFASISLLPEGNELGMPQVSQGKFTDEAGSELDYAQVKYPEAKAVLDKWPAEPAVN